MVKKNKRGERGSADDETNLTTSKRPNMAAAAAEELAEPEEVHSTPTLADIHGILQCIQNSMNKLEIDLAELKSSFKTQETKLKNTQEVLKGAFESNKQLKMELQATKVQVKKQEEHINESYDRIDALEQYSRKNSIEIVGIPEDVCENEEAVLKIAQVLNVDVKAEDIDICHRVKRKHSKPIIARFVSHKVKRALYKSRVRLKNVKLSELFPNASAEARVASERIFINENLTAFRRRLVKLASDKKNDGLVQGPWTIDGKVIEDIA